MNDAWPWLVLFGLGAYHGVNPAMGWLFAVALGLQEGKRSAVLRALPPIALGHALSIAMIVGVLLVLRTSLSHQALKIIAAGALLGFGLYRFARSRHPKWVGMQVGFRDLTLWSFIMASAHGAGLMLIPLFIGSSRIAPTSYASRLNPQLNVEGLCGAGFASFSSPALLFNSVLVHTLGHLALAGLVALLVYEKIGVAILRRAWFNLDLVWVVALGATGVALLFL